MIPKHWCTIDFETQPIMSRPRHPPLPVGLALRTPWQSTTYMAFNHPTGNTHTKGDARHALKRIWDSGLAVVCHNAKFDVEVACAHFDLPMLPWQRVHDTMFLAYLDAPHAPKLDLKSLAEDLLNWPPEEKDAMAEWAAEHTGQLLAAYPWNRDKDKLTGEYKTPRKITPKQVGRWIFALPAEIVAHYACGDVDRTDALFKHLAPIVAEDGMWEAYDRERELMPILLANEQEGMRCDVDRLADDVVTYRGAFERAEDWLRRELRASGLNFDADKDVAAVLSERGIVPDEAWVTTASGQLSTSKDNLLPSMFTGPNGAAIASALGYRNRLKTCITMFMEPWLEQATENFGHITTNWNQTRGSDKGGTRTGRPSTDKHNFLNISKDFEGRSDGYVHPLFLDVPRLPLCRVYVLPDEGDVFLHRDFDGQELRVFAHFEQGELWQAYQDDPNTDPHAMVGAKIGSLIGKEFERAKVKVLNFQAIYGGGAPAAQRKLNCSLAEAREYKAFHDKALPGRKLLNDAILVRVRQQKPICTWGGRLYMPEEPRYDPKLGRTQTFEYKLINYLVQGSAADLTKQAIIDWHNHPKREARFLVTVYDEINISAAERAKREQMALLREVMEAPRLTVPMRSSGKWGRSWGELEKCA